MVLTPEEDARIAELERQVAELKREREIWKSRGLEQLRFKSLDAIYSQIGHTH